jgi:predicted lipoprotein with Yx(FWY)xxD motif
MKRFRPLLVLVAAGLLLAACGDDSSGDDESSDTTAPAESTPDAGSDYGAPADTTEAPGTTAPAGTASATVAVAAIEGVGEALVDADGLTLYLFEQDDGTTTACTGGCADAWPAAVADGEPTGGDGVDASLLETADGQVPNQVVYNGHLLYRFASDAAPGDANGVGIPGWFAVDANGDAIDAA